MTFALWLGLACLGSSLAYAARGELTGVPALIHHEPDEKPAGTYAVQSYPDCAICTAPLSPATVDAHVRRHAEQLAAATGPVRPSGQRARPPRRQP